MIFVYFILEWDSYEKNSGKGGFVTREMAPRAITRLPVASRVLQLPQLENPSIFSHHMSKISAVHYFKGTVTAIGSF